MSKKSFIKDALRWCLGSAGETVTKTIVIFFAVKFLSKEEFGIISVGMLAFSYLTLAQFGFSDALTLKLPKLHVENRDEDFKKYTATVLFFSTGNIILVGFFGLWYFYFSHNNTLLILVLLSYYISGFIYNHYYHYLLLNRYKYNLNITLVSRAAASLLRLGLQLPAIYIYGLKGFLIVESLLLLLPTLMLLKYGYARLSPFIDKIILYDLFRDAIPLFLLTVFSLLIASADRWVIFLSQDIAHFASYSFSVLIGTTILFAPLQLLSMFSQYTRELVAKQVHAKLLFEAYLGWILVISVALGLVSIFINEFSPIFLQSFVPQYKDSLLLIPLVLISILLKAILASLNSFHLIYKNYKAIFFINSTMSFFFLLGAFVVHLYNLLSLNTTLWLVVVSLICGIASAFIFAVLSYRLILGKLFYMVLIAVALNIIALALRSHTYPGYYFDIQESCFSIGAAIIFSMLIFLCIVRYDLVFMFNKVIFRRF